MPKTKKNEIVKVEKNNNEETKEDIKVLYVASECQPFIATGGLADVAGSLPKEIAKIGGVDIRVLQNILGHENLGTTQIYTHVADEQVKSAIEANPLSKLK